MENLDLIINKQRTKILESKGIERLYESKIIAALKSQPLKILSGFRRSGKSYSILRVLKQLIQSSQIKVENILYLNLEDYDLQEFNTAEKLFEIFEYFKARTNKEDYKILVFDEIQTVEDWDKFIRTIYDSNMHLNYNADIIITGSNSELLSSELGSNLAGRFIEFLILPFSFEEYLRYYNLEIKSENDFYQKQEDVTKRFYDYVEFGALPEQLAITDPEIKASYYKGIISKVILDDVVNRFKIRNSILVEKLLYDRFANLGTITSYKTLISFFESIGIETKQETISLYLDYLVKTFALFELKNFSWSDRSISASSPKFYAIDTGIANLYKGPSNKFSKYLENLVFLKLKSNPQLKNIYYANDGKREIDFITENWNGEISKYQVCQELNIKNQARELEPFVVSDKYLKNCPNILLLFTSQEQKLSYKGSEIEQRDLVKWLLGI